MLNGFVSGISIANQYKISRQLRIFSCCQTSRF